MQSIRSRLINAILRKRHLFRFHLKKGSWDNNRSIQEFRDQCEKTTARLAKLPEGIQISRTTIDNIPAEWIIPINSVKDKIILYTHGGGYVSGSCSDHRAIVSKFVKACGITTLLFEYRLAPEYPFPAALEDSVTAYQWLLSQGTLSSNIIIAGESAGGGLCLATLLALKDKKNPLPSGAIAISPWTDLKCTGESYKTKAHICLSEYNAWTIFGKYYYADHDPANPLISPLYGNLHGLPPLYIVVGEDEVLRDDSIQFAKKAKNAGCDVTLTIGNGMVHCYPLLAPFFPEATNAMKEISAFTRKHLGL